MMSAEHLLRARILAGHLCAGLILGTLFGVFSFIVDPFLSFWGRYGYLGVALPRVLEVYMVFGLVAGGALGLVIGVIGVVARWQTKPEYHIAFYTSLLSFVLVVMYVTRNYSVARIKSIPMSINGLWFLLLLAGLLGVGYAFARVLARRNWIRRLGTRSTAVLLVVSFLSIVAVHALADYRTNYLPNNRSAPGYQGANVIVIVLDAFRADHSSAYGYHRDTTPNMNRLAREGVLFENAHSHGNRTIISMPSIFTSLYPSFHGAMAYGKTLRPLSPEHTTMAEVFQNSGYTTVGLMNNVYLKEQFGLVRGFDRVEEYHFSRYHLGVYKTLRHLGIVKKPKFTLNRYPDADEVTNEAIRWVRRLGERPYFLYVHYMDTHHPYAPPEPYQSMFGSDLREPTPKELYKKTTHMIRYGPSIELNEAELSKLIDYYDGSIAFADHEIGRLLDEIGSIPTDRETIVVVTADHGDEFLEHGSLYHTNLVIEELIHIPLIVWSSERFARGARIPSLVRHVDLLPTLADLIGAETPQHAMGRSLVPLLEKGGGPFEVESFAEGDFCMSLNHLNWKIVKVDSTDSYYFYDLSSATGEKEDVSKEHTDIYLEMRTRLIEYHDKAKAVRQAMESEADEETIRQLKALGYL